MESTGDGSTAAAATANVATTDVSLIGSNVRWRSSGEGRVRESYD